MYVEWEATPEEEGSVPWVLVHGGGGQGTGYLTTPDGRLDWARAIFGLDGLQSLNAFGVLSGARTSAEALV